MFNIYFLHDSMERYDCLFRVAIGTRERYLVFLGCNTPFGLFISLFGTGTIHVSFVLVGYLILDVLLIDFNPCVIVSYYILVLLVLV